MTDDPVRLALLGVLCIAMVCLWWVVKGWSK